MPNIKLTEQEIMQINSIQDKNKNYRISLIKRYINFINQRKRVPNSLMNDEYEVELALEYKKVSPSFNLEEKEIINSHLKKLNKYKSTRQLYLDMLKSK